jgi:uncharacterized cupredoxin-like copper-binding protein
VPNLATFFVPARIAHILVRAVVSFLFIGAIALQVAGPTPALALKKTPTPSKSHPCLDILTPTPTSTPIPTPLSDFASPVASPSDATPITTVTPTADPLTAINGEILYLQETIAACASQGDYSAFSQLVTKNYLSTTYAAGQGLTNEQFVKEIAPYLPVTPVRVESVDHVQLSDDGVTADVTTIVGNQLVRFKSTYVEDNDADGTDVRWLLDDERAVDVPRPEGADVVQIRIDDGSFHLQQKGARGPDVVLKGTNDGKATHEMLVVKLGRGTTTEALLDNPGPQFPKGITFVGQTTVAPGATEELVLVDLKPGNYALVCLLYAPDGNPYLASGMKAKLVVT